MTQSIDPSEATLAVLAGGRGERMGFAKGLLQIEGRPILQYLLENLNWPGPTLLVTAPGREHPPAWQFFDAEAVDVAAEGPLRGILTSLQHNSKRQMIIATVDMPGLRQHHLMTALKRLADRPDLLGLMFKNGEGHIEPFPFLCRSEAVDVVAGHLESGRLAVHSLLDADGFAAEFAPSDWTPDVWTNLNYAGDYERFLARQEPLNDRGG